MPNILHRVTIDAPPERVHELATAIRSRAIGRGSPASAVTAGWAFDERAAGLSV